MTQWSPKTKPTLANVRKRLKAAIEALDGAQDLLGQHPRAASARLTGCGRAIRDARAWSEDAIRRAQA